MRKVLLSFAWRKSSKSCLMCIRAPLIWWARWLLYLLAGKNTCVKMARIEANEKNVFFVYCEKRCRGYFFDFVSKSLFFEFTFFEFTFFEFTFSNSRFWIHEFDRITNLNRIHEFTFLNSRFLNSLFESFLLFTVNLTIQLKRAKICAPFYLWLLNDFDKRSSYLDDSEFYSIEKRFN